MIEEEGEEEEATRRAKGPKREGRKGRGEGERETQRGRDTVFGSFFSSSKKKEGEIQDSVSVRRMATSTQRILP